MASSHETHTPELPDSGGKPDDDDEHLSPVPIHVVTSASQLPVEFLEPSPEKKLVIGFDCEGVDLCRHGALCIMQLAFPDAIYLVDVIEGGEMLMKACKPALESRYITKVIHDCKRDSEALYFQFGIKLHNVVDTQIAYSLIKEQEGQKKAHDDYISFVSLLADPQYCGVSYDEKEEVRVLLRKDPNFWKYRPLSDLMIRAAADDVRFLLVIYHKMVEKLNQRSLWYLAVRGALYCRCFCISDNNYADWATLPPVPDDLIVDDNAPEQEILSVLDVPPGKMGRIIGRRGVNILSVKESCNAEIFIGGDRGPPNKVFTTQHTTTSENQFQIVQLPTSPVREVGNTIMGSSLSLKFAVLFSISLAGAASFTTTSLSLSKPNPKPKPKATVADLLSLLGSPQQVRSVNAEVARELRSCFKFLVPFTPTQRLSREFPPARRLLNSKLDRNKRDDNELIWWPPAPVLDLARLAFESGADPGAIHIALDPTIIPVPDVEGTKEDRCELTRTPYGRHFINEELNLYLRFLFEIIDKRGPSVGLNVSLSRYDFFHGHLFLAKDSGRLGILFHAKEYPAYDKEVFPYNMGYCQVGSNVPYDDEMNLRNILWLAPLPSDSTESWLAPGVLVVLDARPGGIIYRDLIPEYVQVARTLYEDDFGEVAVDVNYLNIGVKEPNFEIFIC